MNIVCLSKTNVEELLDVAEAVNTVEQALADLSTGRAVMPIRTATRVVQNDGLMLTMPAFLDRGDALGVKIVSIFKGNPRFALPTTLSIVVLSDAKTGMPIAIMEGTYLTAVRTAAASAVAVRHLAPEGPKTLAIIGTGVQGYMHLAVLSKVVQIARVLAHNRTRSKAESFRAEAEKDLQMKVDIVDSGADAIRGANLIVLATTSTSPVIKWDWVKAGSHINAIGSHSPDARELDDETVLNSRVVVDSRDAALSEAGDLLMPIAKQNLPKSQFGDELGEVISGIKPGRTRPEEVTVFKSVGVAVEDIAVANLVYRKAVAQGKGNRVNLDGDSSPILSSFDAVTGDSK